MLVKLTDQELRTFGGFQWKVGEWRETDKTKRKLGLCSGGYLHAYESAEIAALMNPIHANVQKPRAWEVEVAGYTAEDGPLKFGAEKMRLVREVTLPEYTTTQRIAFGILIALAYNVDPVFERWAEGWLSGTDRSEKAARAEAAAAPAAAAGAAAAGAAAARAEAAEAWTARAAAARAATDKSFPLTLQLCAEMAKEY